MHFPIHFRPLWLAACVATSLTAQQSPMKPSLSVGAQRAADAEARVKPRLSEALQGQGLVWGSPVFLRAFKEERELELWVLHRPSGKFRLFKTYPIAALSGSLGPKLAEGDGQVPEGFYFVRAGNLKPDSLFHLAFNIGFPNAHDRHHDRTGSHIMVHGGAASIGCLAMTDPGIEEIYSLCAAALTGGQAFFRVHLFPFRMTGARMKSAAGQRWETFWRALKPGYDWFETRHIPPDAGLRDGTYVFTDAPP